MLIGALMVLSACSSPPANLSPLSSDAVILAFGDSLTYGTGANADTESYPAILQQLSGITVINAGIPGETSSEGLARLPVLLADVQPDLVILCHGGNDLLRRLDKAELSDNLEQMVKAIEASGSEVLIVGVPTFNFSLTVPDLYFTLAENHKLPSEMTLLSEIESKISLKSDQIHPNAKGYSLFGERIFLLLKSAGALSI